MAEGWQELAATASHEKDSAKPRLLIDKLIQALGQEQKQVREEIPKPNKTTRPRHGTEGLGPLPSHRTISFAVPFYETLDDGKETCDSLILADEAIRVAHYVRHRPRIKHKRYMRLDCFQLVSECDA